MKTPVTSFKATSAPDKRKFNGPRLTPRQARLIAALWRGKPILREQVDHICGASNGPEIVRQLRQKFGMDAIVTSFAEAVDRDGKPCRPGLFSLTAKGRERMLTMGVLHAGC